MELIGKLNRRKINYIKITDDNFEIVLPKKDWVAVPIGDENNVELYSKLAKKCITNDVFLYVCCLGKEGELIHDIFDEVFIQKEMEYESKNLSWIYKDDYTMMTTWHNKDFGAGVWFSIYSAKVDDIKFKEVVFFDFTKKGVKSFLQMMIAEIKSGWLPYEDERYKQPEYDN